ncbi:MAG: flagellar hook-length control protein FliK [Bdellovibrionales bacterium]
MEIGSRGFDIKSLGAMKPQNGLLDSSARSNLTPDISKKDFTRPTAPALLEKQDVKSTATDVKKTDFKKTLSEKVETKAANKSSSPVSDRLEKTPEKSSTSFNEPISSKPIAKKADVQQKTSVDIVRDEEETGEFTVDDKAVMMEFLTSMQKDVGVDPKNIVEAMMSLSEEDLTKPIEETMAQVLTQLNLNPQQKEKAEVLYQEMLTDMSHNAISRWADTAGYKVDMSVMGPEEMQQLRTLQSLDKMSKDFFVAPKRESEKTPVMTASGMAASQAQGLPVEAQPMTASPAESSKSLESEGFFPATSQQMAKPVSASPTQTPSATPTQTSVGAKAVGKNPYGMSSASSAASKSATKTSEKAFDLSAFGFGESAATSTLQVPAEAPVLEEASSSAMTQASTKDIGQSLEQSLAGLGSYKSDTGDSDKGSENKGDSSSQSNSGFAGMMGEKVAGQESLMKNVGGAAAGTQLPTTVNDQTNVRNVLQGAQILIQKGGGEMKVKLTPEGMGSVDLKVMVKNGKVDIQMLTESAETKRLLESSIEELKGSLAMHKLSLENMKVDGANTKLDTALDQGFLNQEREHAREFLGQFRDFNHARRDTLNDLGDLRGYGSSKSKKLRPEDAQIPSTAKAAGKTKRLDLVA